MTRLLVSLLLVLLGGTAVDAQTLQIFHLDVDQADAALVVMPNGKTLLIDSGKNGAGPRLKKAMDDAGVSAIDVFVNSHYHEDHIGGIDELVNAGISVRETFDRGDKARCFTPKELTTGRFGDYMRTVGEDARAVRPGDTIPLDPLVTITVIASSGAVIGDSLTATHCHENDLSVSLLLTFAGFKAFFGGDTEKPTEAKIAARDLVTNIDLYKASHHGSDTSSSAAFLEDLQPGVIVISNGSHAGHKHPKQTILNRYTMLSPAPAVFQTNKCLHPLPCGNVAATAIADLEASDDDGTIRVTVDAATTSYTVAFGSTNRTFPIKSATVPTPTSSRVVIARLLPNPPGNDDQFEEVTVQNKGTASVSLVGWTVRDRSGATWNLSGSLAAGTTRTFRRSGQAMSLNNAGDEVVLVDAMDAEQDRFDYSASSEGVPIETKH